MNCYMHVPNTQLYIGIYIGCLLYYAFLGLTSDLKFDTAFSSSCYLLLGMLDTLDT